MKQHLGFSQVLYKVAIYGMVFVHYSLAKGNYMTQAHRREQDLYFKWCPLSSTVPRVSVQTPDMMSASEGGRG